MRVADVMTTEVLTVGPSASFKSEADLLQKEAAEAHPGGAAGRVRWEEAGAGGKALSLTARDLMTTPVRTVRPDTSLRAIARLMLEGHCRMPVVDRSNRLVGIVTRADLLKVFVRDDAATKRLIERILADHGYLQPEHDIEVVVDEGMVVLRGLTATHHDVTAVGALVGDVEGVVDTNNLLGFTRVDPPPPPDAEGTAGTVATPEPGDGDRDGGAPTA